MFKRVFVISMILIFVFSSMGGAAGQTPKKQSVPEKQFQPTINEVKDSDIDQDELKVLSEYIYQSQMTLDRYLADRIAKAILIMAQKYYISYELLVGMIDIESKFRPWAVSEKGAKGLTQIMFSIHKPMLEKHLNKKLQERDLFTIEISIEAACLILQMYGIIDTPETAIGKYFGQSKATGDYVAKVFYATGKYVAYRQKIRRKLFESVVKK